MVNWGPAVINLRLINYIGIDFSRAYWCNYLNDVHPNPKVHLDD